MIEEWDYSLSFGVTTMEQTFKGQIKWWWKDLPWGSQLWFRMPTGYETVVEVLSISNVYKVRDMEFEEKDEAKHWVEAEMGLI